MKTLVTGGTGFIGSNLAIHLIQQHHEVLITGTQGEQNPEELKKRLLQHSFHDLNWNKIGKIDVLFHQAANNDTTLLDREEMFKANVESPRSLFTQAIEHGCNKIVYASSTAVYGNTPAPYKENETPLQPLNTYAESKKALEELASELSTQHPNVTFIGLRYCNVYGPSEQHKDKRASMVYQLAKQMSKGNPRVFKFGEQKRDYLYIKDAVNANILASQTQENCIVNCGSGKATTFNALIEILNKTLGTNRIPEYIENPYEEKYQSHTECDLTLAKEKINFSPRFNIEAGIKDYCNSKFLV